MTWPESVDEALCFGWIDGVRKRLDETRYVIRFTPRRKGSVWSSVNLGRVQELTRVGLMRPAGLAVHEARTPAKSGIYAYEQRKMAKLPAAMARRLKADRKAWAFFQKQAAWYRQVVVWWIVSAKKEETRERRLTALIGDSAAGRTIKPLTRAPAK
ncbi:MAG: YdeI/OmpD-associated family protein [Gemmatimonadales bacterium]